MAANELLINTRNKKRMEREVRPEVLAMQASLAAQDMQVREQNQRRADALERLQMAALSDKKLADLLLVLGLEKRA